jgi:geranylgeranyl pyrophosphate synthase
MILQKRTYIVLSMWRSNQQRPRKPSTDSTSEKVEHTLRKMIQIESVIDGSGTRYMKQINWVPSRTYIPALLKDQATT